MKKLLLSILLLITTINIKAAPYKIDTNNLFVASRLGDISLYHENNSFFIIKDNKSIPITNDCLDKKLRNINRVNLINILSSRSQYYALFTSQDLKALGLDDNKIHFVHQDDVDEILMDQSFSSSYIVINKLTSGQYTLTLKHRLLGGGFWGAIGGAYMGKFLVHFAAHGTILIIGACTGPAAPATIAALEATFLPTIEAASTVVALSVGIAGGVATGPI